MLDISEISKNTRARDLRVGVFGVGFVGSAIAAAWLRAGAEVNVFDISKDRVDSISKGDFKNLEEKIVSAFSEGKNQNRFRVTADSRDLSESTDIKFVCVPVYLNKEHGANLSFLKSACELVGSGLKRGDSVIVCPSIPPGTTRNIVATILEKHSRLKPGRDFDLIYSPERIYVGRAVEDIESNYPAVISGINEGSLAKAESLFSKVASKGVIKMGSLEEAELEKLAEGVYRDVNIALANELALVCNELGLDYWNVRSAANSQPFCKLHAPGLGVGGACIPVYPWLIATSVTETKTNLLKFGREINESMVEWLVEALARKFGVKAGTKIGILGLAFRGDIADSRLSVTYRLVEKLASIGNLNVRIHDPLIMSDPRLGDILTSDLAEVLLWADIVVIATDHSLYRTSDWNNWISKREKDLILIDGKGILRNNELCNRIRLYGLGYGENPGITES